MKKLLSIFFFAVIVSNAQARQIKIELAIPNEETSMDWQCENLRMDVTAKPCDDCMVEMLVALYEMTPEGECLVCNPCLKTEWEKPACIQIATEDNPKVEEIEITAACLPDQPAAMNIVIAE